MERAERKSKFSTQCFCHHLIETRKHTIICICSSLARYAASTLTVFGIQMVVSLCLCLCLCQRVNLEKKSEHCSLHFQYTRFAVNIYRKKRKKNIDEHWFGD